MIYPYITLADGTEIVYTNVFEEDGLQKVEVHSYSANTKKLSFRR